MIKSVKKFNGILLHFFFFLSVGFLGSWRSPDWRFFLPRLDTEADLTGAGFFLLATPTISTAVLFAELLPGLASFRRRLLRSSLCSCLSLFGWWRFWPHWIVRFHPSDISLYSTRHHLLGRNRRKERFRARQRPRAGLLYYSARIRIRNFPLSFVSPSSTRRSP